MNEFLKHNSTRLSVSLFLLLFIFFFFLFSTSRPCHTLVIHASCLALRFGRSLCIDHHVSYAFYFQTLILQPGPPTMQRMRHFTLCFLLLVFFLPCLVTSSHPFPTTEKKREGRQRHFRPDRFFSLRRLQMHRVSSFSYLALLLLLARKRGTYEGGHTSWFHRNRDRAEVAGSR